MRRDEDRTTGGRGAVTSDAPSKIARRRARTLARIGVWTAVFVAAPAVRAAPAAARHAPQDPSPAAVPGETAREAYIEGWFRETAEGDLEGALRAYRACVERAGRDERELVAKATWRMGRIARARGEEVAATGLFERVVAEFAGTEAARRAAEDLTPPPAPPDQVDAAAADARRYLEEMLGDSAAFTEQKWSFVLATLRPAEILELHHRIGGNLDFLVQRHARDHVAERIDVGLGASPHALAELLGRCAMLERVSRSTGGEPELELTDALVARAGESLTVGRALIELLAAREGDAGIARVREVLSGPAFGGRSPEAWLIDALAGNGGEAASDLLEAQVGAASAAGTLTPESISVAVANRDTRAGAALRDAVRRMPPDQRLDHYRKLDVTDPELGPFALQWLADPEPVVRDEAIGRWLRHDFPEVRARALRAFVDGGPPWQVDVLWREGFAGPFEPMLDVPPPLREVMYWVAISKRREDTASILDHALRAGHEEAWRAAFEPSAGASRDVRTNMASWTPAFLPGDAPRVRTLIDHPDATLWDRAAAVVSRQDSLEIRRQFVAVLSVAARDSVAACRAANAFVRDPDPYVRARLHGELRRELTLDSRLAQFADPSPKIATEAMRAESDPSVLEAAAETLPLDRVELLAATCNASAALRVAFDRLPADSPAARRAFEILSTSDVGIVLEGIGRGGAQSPISRAALDVLRSLPLPSDLVPPQNLGAAAAAELEVYAATLRQRREEVDSAWRAAEIDARLRQARTSQSSDPVAAGVRLAALGARDELKGLLDSIDYGASHPTTVAIVGLGRLGEREAVRAALDRAVSLNNLAYPLVQGGLADLAVELVDAGRLEAGQVEQALRDGDPALLADFLLPPPEIGPRDSKSALPIAVDHLRRQVDVARLVRATDYYHEPSSVSALLDLAAYDAVIDGLSRWRAPARDHAVKELNRLCGLGAAPQSWPMFVVDQEALVARWRAALRDRAAEGDK